MYGVSAINSNLRNLGNETLISNNNLKGQKAALNYTDKDNFQKSNLSKISIPEFSAGKQRVEYAEIKKFHEDIEKNPDRDKISYIFYSTMKDIGSGRYVLALPIDVAKNDKTKDEIKDKTWKQTNYI